MTSKKILIVEDEFILAMSEGTVLRRAGYEITGSVGTGEEAVASISHTRPDLILMDICLAGPMDGIDATKRINNTSDIPVVYLTAFYDEKTVARAAGTHYAAFLQKPVNDRQLVETVTGILGHSA